MNLGEPLTRVHGEEIVLSVDRAMPEVYGYLLHRCGSVSLAEDLTSEAILAAVDHVRNGANHEITVQYLIGIARHKLVDHWRREEREHRRLTSYVGGASDESTDEHFEPGRAHVALAALSPVQRAALTLRYLDDLDVPTVALTLGRSLHATETLLVRAKRAFRDHYSRTASAGHD